MHADSAARSACLAPRPGLHPRPPLCPGRRRQPAAASPVRTPRALRAHPDAPGEPYILIFNLTTSNIQTPQGGRDVPLEGAVQLHAAAPTLHLPNVALCAAGDSVTPLR